jgi:Flp pilus assembly protein TadG
LRNLLPQLNRRLTRNALRSESGVALVELALILPLLMLILLGVLDFGKAFNYWIDETHLANEAARFAVVDKNPGTSGSLQNYILSQADTSEFRSGGGTAVPAKAQVCLAFPSGTSNVGDPVKATVTVVYHWLPFIGAKVGGATKTLSATSTMRLEAPPSNYSAGCSA